MAKETVYIVQSYVAGRGKSLKAEQQVGCKTAEEARRKAERLGPLRPAVVAFSATAETATSSASTRRTAADARSRPAWSSRRSTPTAPPTA